MGVPVTTVVAVMVTVMVPVMGICVVVTVPEEAMVGAGVGTRRRGYVVTLPSASELRSAMLLARTMSSTVTPKEVSDAGKGVTRFDGVGHGGQGGHGFGWQRGGGHGRDDNAHRFRLIRPCCRSRP